MRVRGRQVLFKKMVMRSNLGLRDVQECGAANAASSSPD